MTTDVVIKIRDGGFYDIGFTDDGDIETSQSLDTAILMSIFAEQRATPSEMPESSRRRGWQGNESTPGFEMGSKLWLFEQAKITGSNLAQLGTIITNALKWMIEDNIAISASANAFFRNNRVEAETVLIRPSSEVDKSLFEIWNSTGANL